MNATQYDLNATRRLPRIIEVDTRVLPKPWNEFCAENRIRPHALIGYENEAGNMKIWPAGNIIARGIERGEHLRTDTMIDSTSGNYGVGLVVNLDTIHEQEPDFPIKRVISVVPRTLQQGKQDRLRAYQRMELAFADDSADAMRRAEELAEKHGYWYTRQYWNTDNSAAYKRIGIHVAHQLPGLGMWVNGVGSGGTFDGTVPPIREAFKNRARPQRLHCVAVAVEPGGSVGGVRTEIGLQLNGRPGLQWRIRADDVEYVGLPESLKFSSALWEQYPNDPERRIIAGESTGFALAGGLLAALKLKFRDMLDLVRDEADDVIMGFAAPDTRGPYREDYEAHGFVFPA